MGDAGYLSVTMPMRSPSAPCQKPRPAHGFIHVGHTARLGVMVRYYPRSEACIVKLLLARTSIRSADLTRLGDGREA
jgi:hypothetical protein